MTHVHPTYGEAAAAIDLPLDRWAGNCHGVSTLLVDAGIFPGGVVRRGYWMGTPAENAFFPQNLAQHSWIEMLDGGVIDPTGFAFQLRDSADGVLPDPDAELPYDPSDLYDIGGCRMFQNQTGDPPSHGTVYEGEPVMLETGAHTYIADLLGADPTFVYDSEPTGIEVSHEQAMWLANLPVLPSEGPRNLARFFAAEVYEALANAGCRAYIPIDRLDWIAPDLRPQRKDKHVTAS